MICSQRLKKRWKYSLGGFLIDMKKGDSSEEKKLWCRFSSQKRFRTDAVVEIWRRQQAYYWDQFKALSPHRLKSRTAVMVAAAFLTTLSSYLIELSLGSFCLNSAKNSVINRACFGVEVPI
ncbi:hypothetical protein HHK36_016694 [Tetracentron sinense]|uniref:Uncharacterized protein n=1 Tax=Tetracentron sinense TaxID=13715 RepID=A0A835DEG9_TETSI|nr:hypothetical protein HHK36_016694 [Tetracentron sinense]